jgi:putative selenate reductase molybdopterin-binding subunit
MERMKEFTYIGQPVERVDGQEKAMGEAKFLRDLKIPGMLYGKILRSPFPHARILSIDTEKARKLPGVRTVITADQTPQIKFSYAPHLADKLPLAKDRVRFIGDEVAAVAAIDEEIADEALKLIEVAYEELPAVFDPEDALAPGAPVIHDGKTNIALRVYRNFGDIEEGFALSDEVFEDRYTTQRVTHCCLETRGAIASFSRSGNLTIWSTTQTPYALRNELARILGIPSSRIRVLKTHMGGGFGSRLVMDMIEPIASLLSRQTGKPVALFNTRKDEFLYSSVRYPFIVELKTGVKKDGTLMARKATVIVDNGAYNERGPSTVSNAASSFICLYRTPHVQFDGNLVYTNNLHGAAFRGFGNPQITFAMECQMDVIAEKLGMDPAEIRLKNIFRSGERTNSGAVIRGDGLSECIEQAVRHSGWTRSKTEKKDEQVGTGMAIMIHSGGGVRIYKYNAAEAFVTVREDGKVHVLVGVSEHGQGATTAMAQIVAEELGISPSDIVIAETDTDVNPLDLGAYASRTTYICGNAVHLAALEVKEQLMRTTAQIVEANPTDMEIKDGRVFAKGSPEQGLSVTDAIRAHYAKGLPLSGRGRFADDIPRDMDPATGYGDTFPVYSYSCTVATVKVNPMTGDITVLKLVAANDLGQVINRLGAEGQVEGALLQGLGYAHLEEVVLREGKVLNGNFLDYKLPTSLDGCPFELIMVESNEATGPYGAKGVGEAALVPVAPAIANAIYDAVGVRFNDLPFKKERIYGRVKG